MAKGIVPLPLMLLTFVLVGGCLNPTLEQRLASDNPRLRVSAAHELAGSDDPQAEVRLIHLLADQDQSVRFFAAAGLRRRTGQRLGYNTERPLRERELAISKWVDWYCSSHPDSRREFQEMLSSFQTLKQPGKDAPQTPGGKNGQDQSAQ